MGLRELHRYEFTCDGFVYWDGERHCSKAAVTQGFNPVDAEPPSWDYTKQGWLCDEVHFKDPRYPA